MVQWLRLCTSHAEGAGLIPGQGTKIPHAAQGGQRKIQKLEGPFVFYDITYDSIVVVLSLSHV